jgi:glycyl-tRNA synthetase beta chain
MSADLLLEIGCEDIPARFVAPLASALSTGIADGLRKRGVAVGKTIKTFATPRRIAVVVAGVDETQPEQNIDLTGPAVATAFKDGNPTQAAIGFARKCGVDVTALGQKDGKLHYARKAPGLATSALLPAIFEETLKSMDELVPKRMRWGAGDETFVRPVQWLVCLLGNAVVPLQRFGLTAQRSTRGHRFHAPAPIELPNAAAYEPMLKAARVVADLDARRREIERQVQAAAGQLGGVPRIAPDLLDEVAALVEWPVVIHGRMEDRFMQLPPEVIVSTVETNQRYFTVFADEARTRLLPFFITVCNIESKDVAQVIQGNERVVRPRLADAMFFWEQDLKIPLAGYAPKLDAVTFHKELGSIGDKVRRVRALAEKIARKLPVSNDAAFVDGVDRAALLAKCDLVTRMVYEFPELQGLMGGYYARAAGEPEGVAIAVRDHYLPTQQGTPIPSTPAGRVLALADKLDTLTGIFAVGAKPTASKDPFGLRRAALGIVRICLEGELPLDLREFLDDALYGQSAGRRDSALVDELRDFVLERLRSQLAEQGVTPEVFNAVAATGTTDLLDFSRRVVAVRAFLHLPESQSLAAAHKRIRNILKQASGGATVDPAALVEDAERALHAALREISGSVERAAQQRDYAGALRTLAQLQAPVDAFFDKVMVMAEDEKLRANRLALLRQLDRLCRSVADISCLPG